MHGYLNKMNSRINVASEDVKSLITQKFFIEIVNYIYKKNKVSETVAQHQVIECLRYLYLVSSFPGKLGGLFIPVEQSIDEVWHYLILQTEEYRNLCEKKLPGKFFIEHRSMPYDEYGQEPSREQQIEEALRWLPLYKQTFGGFDENSEPHWTMVRYLREHIKISLDEINSI